MVYEDDSSRFIVGYVVYPKLKSRYLVEALMKAISIYGKPEQILSDHGTTFYAIESDEREKGLTDFEKFLIKEKIKFFNSTDKFMNWYNFIRPHRAFDIERLETPAVIYYQRLPKKEVIMNSLLLENFGVI